MANTIKIKRGSGSDPAASDMVLGEPVLRTDTAELFFKKDDGSVAKVSGGGGGPDFKYLELRNAANNGAASYPNADFTLVTSGTTTAITPAAANTLLVSVNGVIQKPNTGTSTPSSGFALNGSTIKFGGNLSAAPDFILYQESGGIGEPSDETVSEAKLKVSNNPVNGYFLSAQSGNTGGLTWAAPVATSCTGNSATATALATARTINGTSFDGTANITVTAAAGTLTGNTLNSSVTASSLTSLGDLNGLTVTGNMAVDTNTLFVNASANRVGIGTTSPTNQLHVYDGAAANDTPEIKIESFRPAIRFKDRSGSSVSSEIVGDNALLFRVSTPVDDSTALTERMRIDSSGRVGIGTSSPERLLHVVGSDCRIRLSDSDVSPDVELQNSSGDGVLTTNSTTNLRFNTNNSEAMRIDSSGNVGIGRSSSIDQKLYVQDTSQHSLIRVIAKNDQEAGIDFGDTDDLDIGRIRYGNDGNYMRFFTNAAERLRINSAGDISIGLTSGARTPVHIHEPSTSTANVHITNTTTGTGSQDGLTIFVDGTSSAGFWYRENAPLRFATNNSERMRILNTGQIGIGNTNPSSFHSSGHNLVVGSGSGEEGMTIYSGSSSGGVINFADSTSGSDSYEGRIIYNHSDNSMRFHVNDGAERVRILSNARVAFGHTTTTGLGSHTGNASVCTFNFAGVTLTQYGVVAGFYYDRLNFTNSQYFIVNSSGTGVYLGNGSTSFTAYSDERLKENITELDSLKAYNHVKTARAASFKWKATGYPTDTKIGFIAQDWETNYPEVTNSTTETIDEVKDPKGIQYTETIPVLMAALKQAINKIETLETKVAALEAK